METMTIICEANCWTAALCPTCGNDLPPRGRSVAPERGITDCCDEARMAVSNRRHLWNEHDEVREITDPDGWLDHIRRCETCRTGSAFG